VRAGRYSQVVSRASHIVAGQITRRDGGILSLAGTILSLCACLRATAFRFQAKPPSVIGEPFIIFGDAKHHLPCHRVAPLFCDQARCVGEATPVVSVVGDTVLPTHVLTTKECVRALIEGQRNCNLKVGGVPSLFFGQRRLPRRSSSRRRLARRGACRTDPNGAEPWTVRCG
jgi:hypothetical protein